MRDALILFLGRHGGFDGWVRLSGDAVVARGRGIGGSDGHHGASVVAVAPGEQVSLRWVDMPDGLTPAQATAAARLMAAEWTAQPLAELHLAVGRASAEGRCVAAAPVAAVEAWLDTVREAGFEAERLVPEPLLLEPPAEGMARLDRGAIALFRSRSEAFAAEPELAAMLLDGQAVVDVDPATFEDRLSPALAEAPVDLRQGPFGRRRELRVEGGRVRRLALLSAALLLASIGVELAAVARYSLAADRAEEETRRIAAAVLPGGSAAAENSGAIEDRLAELRGGGEGFTATAGALFEAVKATPNVELTALAFSPDGAIRATVASSSPPALDGVRQRLEAAGFAVETLAPRAGGGRRLVDIVARPR